MKLSDKRKVYVVLKQLHGKSNTEWPCVGVAITKEEAERYCKEHNALGEHVYYHAELPVVEDNR